MTSQERQAAVLVLVDRLLKVTHSDAPGHDPARFTQLCDGIALFAMLRLIAPNSFPSTCSDSTEEDTVASLTGPMPVEDVQQRRRNMNLLLRYISAYAQEAMRTTSSTSVTHGLDPAVLAGLPVAGDDDSAAADVAQQQQLTQLVGVAVALVVLSGVPAVLSEVRALPRQEQVVLSDWVKEIMHAYQLKPRQHAGAASEQGSSSSSSHLRSSMNPQFAGGGLVAASPMVPRGTAGFAPSPPSHRSANLNAAAAGEEDEGYYRNATYQLRRELAEVTTQLAALHDAYRVSTADKEAAEGKYRLLLSDQAKVSPALGAMSVAAAAECSDSKAGDDSSSDILSVWQRRCAQKDKTIAALAERANQQSTQVVALKEAAAAHEMALQALRRRLKSAEEAIMVKSEERREAVQKLAVAEDRLAAQMRARVELETQVEELQSRVLVLTVEQDRLRGLGNDDTNQLSSSFASNGSVDRLLALENELDEVRQQRDSLQWQVGILQRQMGAMVAPVADVSTANDTWRAQLRQVEREREDLRQQLTTALERAGGLQQLLTASAAASAVVDVSGGGAGPDGPASGTANADASITSVAEGSDADMSLCDADADSLWRRNMGLEPSSPTRETACREQVILSSLLLQYGYRNLLLQQHQTLLHKDAMEADAARRRQAESHLEIMRQTPSSVLAKQRRDVEQGLLETVLLGAKLRMMEVEK
ncbi:conserved hypothetical protein [Leishmania braziliensis MHOM/BR/75/M2904]|uniref:Uncharacterized protein n=2 Tax=Leishmania braziliensis TaxID=5660 RepID=A4HI80_LEIBR|nr:conserved hypothetical protein [Leishmania braziliensis MHOM/BR/75/M2904]CAJ2477135.1 unnamed protein product [Leishmania braziliensis]CAJ2477588.1 unnamed protein product [Leishmania braziliensis]CAM40289.1 conserved hypothetical protein [Leishmania braziliensis MHOM/BR/75/M2904]SYZ67949.1 hypothetical_protein [Leishmania braziliensis MHOM/BR/75/M2904]